MMQSIVICYYNVSQVYVPHSQTTLSHTQAPIYIRRYIIWKRERKEAQGNGNGGKYKRPIDRSSMHRLTVTSRNSEKRWRAAVISRTIWACCYIISRRAWVKRWMIFLLLAPSSVSRIPGSHDGAIHVRALPPIQAGQGPFPVHQKTPLLSRLWHTYIHTYTHTHKFNSIIITQH